MGTTKAENGERGGTTQAEENAAALARGQNAITVHITRMLAFSYHPHEQVRLC
jgi:hypothetical protein